MKNLFYIAIFFGLFSIASAESKRDVESSEKLTFVIVHGATAGGWEWKRTGDFLVEKGHAVFRVTLTGLGERHHLSNTEIDLNTHIEDVVNVVLFEGLDNIVLSGHSYGGMVITGVMDRIPERIRHVIYLDAAVPDDGESLYDVFDGPRDDSRVSDGMFLTPWVKPGAQPPHNTPQSIRTFSQPVSYKNPLARALPVTFVAFIPEEQTTEERAESKSWQRAKARGWTIRTFPGGHVAQQENPQGVADLMEDAVSDQNEPESRSSIR